MELTVLGCAGTFPGPDSACSSYLVEQDGFRLLLDCGNGSIGALQRHGGLLDLDAVLLSHLHADHCIDLVAYAYARIYHPTEHPPVLPVYGPAGTHARLLRAIDSARPTMLEGVYDFRTLLPGPLRIGPFELEVARMRHPVECYGVRVSAEGRALAYSADTAACPELLGLARDVDLFLCEASFLSGRDNPLDVHLTGREAGECAAAAGARSLLLTHLVAWGDPVATVAEARAAYPGEIRLAQQGSTYQV